LELTMRLNRRHALLLPLLLAAAAAAPHRAPDTLVLLVRHAEKAGPSGDVALSPAGETRAQALVDIARGAGVTAIVTTQFQRTRQTAAPTASALGVKPYVDSAGADVGVHAAHIADFVRREHAPAVLIVGHSNTVPAIVAALGGPKLPDICDAEYDRLYILSMPESGQPRLIQARYGAPSSGEGCPAMR
jgi:broad specificity phosphatase PhoE